MMILFFFVAVLLVIAGTYLLFTSGSITLLKLCAKTGVTITSPTTSSAYPA